MEMNRLDEGGNTDMNSDPGLVQKRPPGRGLCEAGTGEVGTQGSPDPHDSLQVATDKDNGILLYKGDNDPLALELYQGHVRLVYDSLSSPPTTVYR